jgi:hypothetical protein
MNEEIANSTATVNPYILGLYLIFDRLKWDLSAESWKSRKKLRSLKDKYSNQKAVILCNGPSLLKSDLGLLDNVFTFGLNKINLMFDKNRFRPSCIVANNLLVIEQNADFYNDTDIPLFIDSKGKKFVTPRKNVTYIHTSSPRLKFARDCSISIYQGFTVTFVALQLAYHMGFNDVALIGCDHNFATKGPANKSVTSGETDPNHFDPNYFAGGVKWQLPDLFQSEVSYHLANSVYEASGRKIWNATAGGQLEIFPRIELSDFINKKS